MSLSTRFLGIFLCCLFSGKLLYAQQPVIEWQKSLGGTGSDAANCVIQTADGGYITVGSVRSNDGDVTGYHGFYAIFDDCWIIKMNGSGIVDWKRCLGGSANDNAYSIIQTSDGGYIIAGETSSVDGDVINSNTLNQCWIVKINNTGTILWQKTFGGYGQSSARYIKQTSDGGYIVAATTSAANGDVTFNHGGGDIWILKLSNAGNIQWQKCYGGSRDEYAKEIQPTTDGGYIIMGNTASADGDVTGYHEGIDYGLYTRYRTDAWVIKINSTGILEWQQTMGGTAWDAGNSIVQADDGGYVFTGFTQSTDGNVTVPVSGGENTIWNVKLNSSGTVAWQKNYGGIQFQQGNCIKKTTDGGYIIAAEALPNPLADPGNLSCNTLGVQDYWIIKTDAGANLTWQQTYGSNGNDFAYSLQQTTDGGYIVAGMGAENSGDIISKHFSDFWIIKLRPPLFPSITIIATDSVICQSAEVTFTAAVSFGGVTPVYQWKKNGVSVGSNIDTYTTSALNNKDTVYCLLTSKAACAATITQSATSNIIVVSVTGTVKPSIDVAGSNSICAGTPVAFTATVLNAGADAVFQWQVNGSVIPGETNSSYSSSVLNNLDTVICNLIQPAAACYQSVSDSIVISVNSSVQPTVSIAASVTNICEGTVVKFIASPQNGGLKPTYQWKVNNSLVVANDSIYTTSVLRDGDVVSCDMLGNAPCTVSGNTSSNKIAVTVKPFLPISISISTNSVFPVCAGSVVSFTASVVNGGISPSLQWQVNQSNIGSGGYTFTSSLLNNGDSVQCLLLADSSNACIMAGPYFSNKIIAILKKEIHPPVTITASTNNICKGTPVIFTAVAKDQGALSTYQWKLNSIDAGSSSNTYAANSLTNGDQVFCILTPVGDCQQIPVSSNVLTMNVFDLPVINISASGTLIEAGKQVQLNAAVTGNISNFNWEPTAALISTATLSPLTIPLVANTTFILHAENQSGCKAVSEITIKVLYPFYMPSAFSPNGDGVNDVYRIPPNSALTLKEFLIYDRWGKLVFSSKNSATGWDGKIKGEDAANGNYIFVISGTDIKGKVFLKGNFILIR